MSTTSGGPPSHHTPGIAAHLQGNKGFPPQQQKLFLSFSFQERKCAWGGYEVSLLHPHHGFCCTEKGCCGRELLPRSSSHLCLHLPLQGRVSCSQEEGWAAPGFGSGFQGCLVWGSLTAAPRRVAAAAAAASLSCFPFQPLLGSGAGKSPQISFLILILIFFILKRITHACSEQQQQKISVPGEPNPGWGCGWGTCRYRVPPHSCGCTASWATLHTHCTVVSPRQGWQTPQIASHRYRSSVSLLCGLTD